MKKPNSAICISFIILLFIILSGCSTTKSAGEIMLSGGEETTKLGEQWIKGESLIKKGEKLRQAASIDI